MLGDGTLEPYKQISARLQVRRQIAHEQYNLWLMQQMPALRWATPKPHFSSSMIDGRRVEGWQHQIRTGRMRELQPWRARWYPDGKKRVPRDLCLTPQVLAVWLMDDGGISFSKQVRGGTVAPKIDLFTCGFPAKDVEFLRRLLFQQHGILASVQARNVISIGSRIQVPKLTSLVDPFVQQVPCMGYKIDLSRMTPV